MDTIIPKHTLCCCRGDSFSVPEEFPPVVAEDPAAFSEVPKEEEMIPEVIPVVSSVPAVAFTEVATEEPEESVELYVPPPLPEDAPKSFSVTLQKEEGTLGLGLDVADSITATITSVSRNSVVAIWNTNTSSELIIRPNDRIVEANGSRGNSKELIWHLKLDSELHLLVQRPTEVSLTFIKGQLPLGVEITCTPEASTLLIVAVTHGCIQNWNERSRGPKVKKNDRIIEVNGVRGCAKELFKLLTGETRVSLVCLCYSS